MFSEPAATEWDNDRRPGDTPRHVSLRAHGRVIPSPRGALLPGTACCTRRVWHGAVREAVLHPVTEWPPDGVMSQWADVGELNPPGVGRYANEPSR